MKKCIALGLVLILAVLLFGSCGNTPTPVETTAGHTQKYEVEDKVLKSCIGQADENGVYVVPDTITVIGEGAFVGDETLREIVIGKNVTTIGCAAFQGCTSLEKVTIEEGISAIGSYAFYGCSALRDVNLPSTVTELSPYTFYGCESIESLDLSGIKEIRDCAMWYCLALESVKLSPELTRIGRWAFAQCRTLSDVNIADCKALRSVAEFSFSGCNMLTSLALPEGTESVGVFAFHDCVRLNSIVIPKTVKTIDYGAFNYTPWYQENTAPYLVVGDGILIKCNVRPDSIDLANKGIRYIGAAFWNAQVDEIPTEYGYKYAEDLKKAVVPEGVEIVGAYAFRGCYQLEEVSLPSTVTRIESNAFNVYVDGVLSKTKVTPLTKCPSLAYIGDFAFHGCGELTDATLPTSTSYVGQYAFVGTSAFDSFYEAASKTEDKSKHRFITGDHMLLFGYVPDGETSLVIPEGVKIVGGGAYCGWDNPLYVSEEDKVNLSASGRSKHNISFTVTSLSLPSTLETICDNAFFRMTLIENVELPEALRTIGDSAFAFCGALRISNIKNVTELGNSVFASCTAIEEFQLDAKVQKIGSNVFADCPSLRTVSLPKGMIRPGEELFNANCTSLREIILDPNARPTLYTILGGIGQELKVRYYIYND